MRSQTIYSFILIVMLFLGFMATSCGSRFQAVTPGLDILVQEKLPMHAGKRIGIVTNHTALNAKGEHIVDVLVRIPELKITVLFAPEHGIRGDRTAGDFIPTYYDSLTHIPVYSLYQEYKKPTPQMLDSVDVLIYDIQDVGVRFYTYISTMAMAMEAAAEKGIPFIVLDRPNPITGEIIEGPVRQPEYISFVGLFPIPIRYGMTIGELALMINGEGWLANHIKADLTVIPMKNWQRLQWFDQTSLPWVKTSPNIPTLAAATVYPGTCLLEGVNISEGRGTPAPFSTIGAPWLSTGKIKKEIASDLAFGVEIKLIEFTPVSIPNVAPHPEYEGTLCSGLCFTVTDRNVFRAVSMAVYFLSAVQKYHPEQLQFNSYFDQLVGNNTVKQKILDGVPAKEIIAGWDRELNEFKALRKKYLLY